MGKRIISKVALLERCARCGKNHRNLEFIPLYRPIQYAEGLSPITHWALCPNNGDPILMRITDGKIQKQNRGPRG